MDRYSNEGTDRYSNEGTDRYSNEGTDRYSNGSVDQTTILTDAITAMASENRYYCYFTQNKKRWVIGRCGLYAKGMESIDGFVFRIHAGILRPIRYKFTSSGLKIECSGLDGVVYFHDDTHRMSDLTCIYKLRVHRDSEIHFYDSIDTSSFRDIPEPDEDGRLVVSPPGGLTKTCRK